MLKVYSKGVLKGTLRPLKAGVILKVHEELPIYSVFLRVDNIVEDLALVVLCANEKGEFFQSARELLQEVVRPAHGDKFID